MPKNDITRKKISEYSQNFNKTRVNRVFKNMNTKNTFTNIIMNADYIQNKNTKFSDFINIETKLTDQKNSGRCWLFAFMNVMRLPMIKKYNLEPNFEFSQNYLFFYDKLEKANFFLNYIYDNKTAKLDDVTNYDTNDLKVIHLLDTLTSDGGDWNMFVNLIEKYGIVPKTNMDDDFHSVNSDELTSFYNDFLRKSAKRIRESKENVINEILEECYKILVVFLGEPPNKVTWEYYSKGKGLNKEANKKYNVVKDIDPVTFYKKYVPYDAKTKVCLMNYPCKQAPYYKAYVVELNQKMEPAHNSKYINVPIEVMRNAVKKSIDRQEAVWFGCDVGKYFSRKSGFFDEAGFNYDDVFGFNNSMDKCDSLDYRQSTQTHAMVIRGYNFKGKGNGYLVENSWGTDNGFGDDSAAASGNYFMSSNWFDKYAFSIVVDRHCLTSKELRVLNQKPVILPYWSPFGNMMMNRKIN